MGHIFISYSRKDKVYAQKLAESLRKYGFDIWIDGRIDYGDRWWQEIVKAIRACDVFVVIMTPDAEVSEWVEQEVLLAKREQKPLLPLLLKGKEFPLLITTQFADVTDGELPPEDFYTSLAEIIMPEGNTGKYVAPALNIAIGTYPSSRRASRWKTVLGGVMVIIVILLGVFGSIPLDIFGQNNGKDQNNDPTNTPPAIAQNIATPTSTPSSTVTFESSTNTPTSTNTTSALPTNTSTSTHEVSLIPTASDSPTATYTPTYTSTPTLTATNTYTLTSTPTQTTTIVSEGKLILAIDDAQENPIEGFYLLDLDDGKIEKILDIVLSGEPTCSSQSGAIFYYHRGIYRFPLTGSSSPIKLTDGFLWRPALSPDGQWLAYYDVTSSGDAVFNIIRTDGTEEYQLGGTGTASSGIDASWSSKSDLIAFVSNFEGQDDIYVANINSWSPINITNTGGRDNSPVWSPNSDRIAFISFDSGWGLYVVNSDGTNLSYLGSADNGGLRGVDTGWSSDAQQIYFHRDGNLYAMAIDGSVITNMGREMSGILSPRGDKIAYNNYGGDNELYIKDLKTGDVSEISYWTQIEQPHSGYFLSILCWIP